MQETLFGFREWTRDGIFLRLNGVKWQGFTEHGVPGDTPEEHWRRLKTRSSITASAACGRNTAALPVAGAGAGGSAFVHGPRRRLRRTGYLDGEAAGYMPAVLPELGGNWIDHLAAWIKGERNHPSIMIWSVENELNFINARNLGQLDNGSPC